MLTSIELCAGAGGQALGLEMAGFEHEALVEIDPHCCNTLRHNRPSWNVLEEDLKVFKESASKFKGVDLVAGGLPLLFQSRENSLGPAMSATCFPMLSTSSTPFVRARS